jgi:hypothetical protein
MHDQITLTQLVPFESLLSKKMLKQLATWNFLGMRASHVKLMLMLKPAVTILLLSVNSSRRERTCHSSLLELFTLVFDLKSILLLSKRLESLAMAAEL